MSRGQALALILAATAPAGIGVAATLLPDPARPPAPASASPPSDAIVPSEGAPLAEPAPTPTAVPATGLAPAAGATPTQAPSSTPAPTSGSTPAAAAPPPLLALAGVQSEMDPATCLARYRGMALPRHRGDEALRTQTQVCRRGYVLSYNSATQNPDWVVERLDRSAVTGPAKRRDRFKEDPLLKTLDADDSNYVPRRYDRGHQAPAADAAFDQTANDESFYFSNMSPQVGIGFNRGIWKYLEEVVRGWVLCGGRETLFVVTGPIYNPPRELIGKDRVVVPAAFYKIVYDPVADRALGFVLENRKIGSRIDRLQDHVRPIAEIETETGLDFFPDWSARRQRMFEAKPGLAWAQAPRCNGAESDD